MSESRTTTRNAAAVLRLHFPEVSCRATGASGASAGDDAAARNQPADLPWRVGPARTLAHPSSHLWTARARAHGLDGAAGRRSGRHETASPRAWSWAALMHRAFGIDVLACAHCGGRLRLIATLHDPAVIRKILAHLGPRPLGAESRPRPIRIRRRGVLIGSAPGARRPPSCWRRESC
jgi:hypothetical protein